MPSKIHNKPKTKARQKKSQRYSLPKDSFAFLACRQTGISEGPTAYGKEKQYGKSKHCFNYELTKKKHPKFVK